MTSTLSESVSTLEEIESQSRSDSESYSKLESKTKLPQVTMQSRDAEVKSRDEVICSGWGRVHERTQHARAGA